MIDISDVDFLAEHPKGKTRSAPILRHEMLGLVALIVSSQ